MSNDQYLNMTTAFFVSEEYPKNRENVKEFALWLENEGYREVKHGYDNLFGAYYIDIETMTYAKVNADALLAPIVGCQGLKYDDFKEIHRIFKRTSEIEKTWTFRPAYLTPLPLYLRQQNMRRQKLEQQKQDYFGKSPTFERWCDDVFTAIKENQWYKENWPDYSKESFLSCTHDPFIRGQLVELFKEQQLPFQVAGQWDQITF